MKDAEMGEACNTNVGATHCYINPFEQVHSGLYGYSLLF